MCLVILWELTRSCFLVSVANVQAPSPSARSSCSASSLSWATSPSPAPTSAAAPCSSLPASLPPSCCSPWALSRWVCWPPGNGPGAPRSCKRASHGLAPTDRQSTLTNQAWWKSGTEILAMGSFTAGIAYVIGYLVEEILASDGSIDLGC